MRHWYDKARAWREKNKPDEELVGFYAEAAKLLATQSQDTTDANDP